MDCRLTVTLGGAEGETYSLRDGVTSVGRDTDNDIQLMTDRVSRHHARFTNLSAVCRLEDLNSTNGTLVNGRKITSYDLKSGDEVTIGELVMRFEETSGWDSESRSSTTQRHYTERSQMATVMLERRSESPTPMPVPGEKKEIVNPFRLKSKDAPAQIPEKEKVTMAEKAKTQPINVGGFLRMKQNLKDDKKQ
jgi:predicted component of type VI protein secretion system